MNEAETRAEHIDPALKAAGWGVVEGSRIRRELPITPGRIEGLGRRGKGLTADSVLEYRNTKLAVVEAKAWNQALTEGVAQAKNYAGKLAVRFTYTCPVAQGKRIRWNPKKNLEHPNTRKFPNRRIWVVRIRGYAHVVPFVETDEEIFLKTIMPSRKATRQFIGEADDEE